MWIDRDISAILRQNSDPIQILRGPRQCGKSSLFLHLDPSFKEVSLDDPAFRELAQSDPELFLSQFDGQKLFIDEAQYAPNLFPSLKRKADLYKRDRAHNRETIIRLTGSNQILLDQQVKESLSGRASYYDLNTLSVKELLQNKPRSIQEILFNGGYPELYASPNIKTKKFLDDYINSYIEKDIVLAAGIQKSREFLRFIKLAAGRVGQLVDLTHFGNETGVDTKTIKDWISVLETMHIIRLVPPYSTNLSSRLIKSPKLYFLDTGLAVRLQGWTEAEPLALSPQQGPLFENLVFAELYKTALNFQMDLNIFHWRSRAGEEIDFLLHGAQNEFIFLEAKVTPRALPDISKFAEVKKVFRHKPPPVYQCHQEGKNILAQNIPIALLGDFLLHPRR